MVLVRPLNADVMHESISFSI